MRKFLLLLPLTCAALSGCKTATVTNACDGWQILRPTLETAVHVTMNDRAFANSVAAHNLHGRKLGCWK
ncbi:MAG: hypothetical protein DI589_06550 [Shinella sp.]|nr:MAG: hypothetical protein DI589_06550 [Shinella sp.]